MQFDRGLCLERKSQNNIPTQLIAKWETVRVLTMCALDAKISVRSARRRDVRHQIDGKLNGK